MLLLSMLANQDGTFTPLFWTNNYSSLHGDAHSIMPLTVLGSNHVLFTYSESDIVRTPGRATFGGFWPTKSTQRIDSSLAILAYASFFEKFPNQKEAKIVLPPEVFFPDFFKPQLEALLHFGTKESIVDFNYHVEIENWSRKQLSKGNRKKIRQFRENGGNVSFAGLDSIKECYEVLVENRRRRGVYLTMKYHDFENSLLLYGDDFMLIHASFDTEIVATSYVVKILPDYWYVLFWGELPSFRSFSPVASIFDFLISEATKNHVKFLDLGISSDQGVLDEGLATFKSNLGAVVTERMTLVLDLNHAPNIQPLC
jgi:hypothetical protein